MQRGEIWMVSLPFSGGREQSGERPAIIIQDAIYGQGSPLVLIVLLTSQLAAMRFPATVRIDSTRENGLSYPSVAMIFQARALDRSRFLRKLGTVTHKEIMAVLAELNRLTGQ
jgi:mRNA interferase MazF